MNDTITQVHDMDYKDHLYERVSYAWGPATLYNLVQPA